MQPADLCWLLHSSMQQAVSCLSFEARLCSERLQADHAITKCFQKAVAFMCARRVTADRYSDEGMLLIASLQTPSWLPWTSTSC
jgi:hypothetical protein